MIFTYKVLNVIMSPPGRGGRHIVFPLAFVGLLRVSEYSDIRGSEYKIEYEYSSLPKSLDRDLFFFFFFYLF